MTTSFATTGPTVFSLRNARSDRGLLRGRLLHFGGFTSEAEAFRAGEAGCRLLTEWLTVRKRLPIDERPRATAVIGDDGIQRWTDPGGQTMARIVRPGDDPGGDDSEGCPAKGHYGVQYILPGGLFAAVALHLANLIYEAMMGPTSADADQPLARGSVQG
jgi:hypothetical protein